MHFQFLSKDNTRERIAMTNKEGQNTIADAANLTKKILDENPEKR